MDPLSLFVNWTLINTISKIHSHSYFLVLEHQLYLYILRGGKKIPLKKTVDAALVNCPGVKTVLVQRRTGAKFFMGFSERNGGPN